MAFSVIAALLISRQGAKTQRNPTKTGLIPPAAWTDDLGIQPNLLRRRPMETFTKLFERFLVFVYHCFDRIVIQGYLPLLTRPEHIVHFFRDVHGQYPITPQVLAKRTLEYRGWVESYARNHKIPMLRAEKGVSKEDAVRPHLQRMERRNQHGVYCIFTSMRHARKRGNGQYVHFEDAPVPYR
jgi:hypothetical protein